jgi:hypothetical protein
MNNIIKQRWIPYNGSNHSLYGVLMTKNNLAEYPKYSLPVGYQDEIYLTSQTWSYRAINIYLSFGFQSYHGPKPINWQGAGPDFEPQSTYAWRLITEKINQRKGEEPKL